MMKPAALFATFLALAFPAATQASPLVEVDVELVLAVDISYSMDPEELSIQRQGYMKALTSGEVLRTIGRGALGRVAVTYVEWAGVNQQSIIVGWQMIENAEDAERFAAMLGEAPVTRAYRTSISGALTYAASLFGRSPFSGHRRVIDISGDGLNNNGPPVAQARDVVLAQGIVINGLPLMLDGKDDEAADTNLEDYYRDCVIGGAGSFLVAVNGIESFEQAVRTKLVLEIAGHQPAVSVLKARSLRPRVPCVAGEAMWQQRYPNP
jgi:hypothetical protein